MRPRPRLGLFGTAIAVALLVGIPAPASAQSADEHIASYDVAITVERGGSIRVVERIAYDFGSNERHGIFRDIPVRFTYNDRYDRLYKIHDVSVSASGGASGRFKVLHQGSLFRIRIGDPNRTTTGRHTYTISYTVDGALNGFADHDELYWNAIGTQWDVPIDAGRVEVSTPAEVLAGTACFAGSFGSNLPCTGQQVKGSTATFRQSTLGPGEGMTVVVGLSKGVVAAPAPILKERWSPARAFSLTPVTGGVAGALVLLLVGAIATIIWRVGRDRRVIGTPIDVAYGTPGEPQQAVPLLEHPVIPVEYAPPDNIRPGQMGTLVDEKASPVDVTATIVDLAVRGYLRIEEIPKEGWFGKPDWRLVRLKDSDGDLLAYERILFDGVFEDADEDEGGEPAVKLSSLKTKFVERLHRVQNALYTDAVRRGWFSDRPDKVRSRWRVIGLVVLAAGIGLVVLLAAKTHYGLVPIPFVLAGLLLLWGAHLMPRRTPKGTGMARRARGFRIYIDTAEKREARFDEKENIFSRYLPYAIVFGLTEKWGHAFSVLGQPPPSTGWYVGTRPFAFATFASSIDHFTVSSAGTIASTPGGSGGSGLGGGGFSGGGGGGGGGGSW